MRPPKDTPKTLVLQVILEGKRLGLKTDDRYNCKCRRPADSPHHDWILLMGKSSRYIVSSKPALWAGGSDEVASTIAPPTRYRAPENTYTKTRGAKLYKKGGTLATRVIKSRVGVEVKIINEADNENRRTL